MQTKRTSNRQKGFTLLETMIAMVVLSFGILSLASVFGAGLKSSDNVQIQFIAQQKAQEAMETIFTARDTRLITWAQMANVANGGVFLDGPQPLLAPGPDGLVGTADDDAANPNTITTGPGPDQVLGTADDTVIKLNPWMTRTIQFIPVVTTPNLQKIVVTITYNYEGVTNQFTITSYISNYA
jgi:prepilin-type N-terminal cleavage/methylation domain-containing protein